ncbi:MAG: VWA domain-containing protein [Chloroflexota bacterium]
MRQLTPFFAHPHLLWLLLAVPLAAGAWWHGQRQRRAAARRLGEQQVLGRLLQHVNHNGRFAQNLLWLIALAALALALARPQWGSHTQMVRQEGLQILFVLDVSPSMMVADGAGALNRLEEAKQAIATLMAALPQHEMGLVLFSGSSQLFLPLTRDHATAQTLLAQVSPDLVPRPGTAVSHALHTASQTFNQRQAIGRVIILLSDGEDHEAELAAAAQTVQQAAITLYMVGVGTTHGGPVPTVGDDGAAAYKLDAAGQFVISRANPETLQALAEQTNGRYFPAADIANLPLALEQLAQSQQNGRLQTLPIERFPLFLWVALLAMFAAEMMPPQRKTAVFPRQMPIPAQWLLVLLLSSWLLVSCTARQQLAQAVAQGNTAFAAEEFTAAHEAYAAGQTATASQMEPAYNQANTFYREADFERAADLLRQALGQRNQPQLAAAFHNLGNSYFQRGEWGDAIAAYQTALRYNPADEDTKYNLELAWQQLAGLGAGADEDGVGGMEQDETGEAGAEQADGGGNAPLEDPLGAGEKRPLPGGTTPNDGVAPAIPTAGEPVDTLPPVESLSPEQAYGFLTEIGRHSKMVPGTLPQSSMAPPVITTKDW